MLAQERFALQPIQKYTKKAADCPIRVCCSRQCTEVRSGVKFLQVRMHNMTDRFICSVFLSIDGSDKEGKRIFSMREVILTECNAKAGAYFGEERMIAVKAIADSVKITVERVVFDDGMIWCRATVYRPKVQAAAREVPEPVIVSAKTEKTFNETTERLPVIRQKAVTAHQTLKKQPAAKVPAIAVQQPKLPVAQVSHDCGITAPLTPRLQPKPAPIIREAMPTMPVLQKKRKKGKNLLTWILIVGGIVLTVGMILALCPQWKCSLFF